MPYRTRSYLRLSRLLPFLITAAGVLVGVAAFADADVLGLPTEARAAVTLALAIAAVSVALRLGRREVVRRREGWHDPVG